MDVQIRDRSIIRGRKKPTAERAAYLRLMQQGMSNTEACQTVGVNPRTGRRWRNGHNATGRDRAAAPIHTVLPPTGPSRYLRENDRIHIADLHREGKSVRVIAAELGRDPATISRELRRNATVDPRGKRHYRPHAAQARADARRPRPRPSEFAQHPQLNLRGLFGYYLSVRCLEVSGQGPSKMVP